MGAHECAIWKGDADTDHCRAGVVYSIQNWLGESEMQKKTSTTPGYFNVSMASTAQPSPIPLGYTR